MRKFLPSRKSLPTSEETGLGEVLTREANSAVEAVLNQDKENTKGKKEEVYSFYSSGEGQDSKVCF